MSCGVPYWARRNRRLGCIIFEKCSQIYGLERSPNTRRGKRLDYIYPLVIQWSTISSSIKVGACGSGNRVLSSEPPPLNLRWDSGLGNRRHFPLCGMRGQVPSLPHMNSETVHGPA